MAPPSLAQRVLGWQATHGRHDLPWQHPRTPYRVWLSEVMLQQTTVSAVIPYFKRFVARFPDVGPLAAAPLDEVLSLWQGLGYYARARNLHACAQRIQEDYGGEFPANREALEALPGIGRSTAAAICAQAFGLPEAILDANVKRVFSRHSAEQEWPGKTAAQKRLWSYAESHLPSVRLPDYTQGLMDLGATICIPKQPRCGECPIADDCQALRQGLVESLPIKAPRKNRSRRQRYCLMWLSRRPKDQAIWLERRPPSGLWGGLWCPPHSELLEAQPPTQDHALKIKHVFTHFDLHIYVMLDEPPQPTANGVAEELEARWVTPQNMGQYGLPTAVHRILEKLSND
nr:A/G-specific adenine glycosylase [Oceanococcus sp. HetDA_MAG_MS8]